ncbi:unnamed protein product [Alternaria alternata]
MPENNRENYAFWTSKVDEALAPIADKDTTGSAIDETGLASTVGRLMGCTRLPYGPEFMKWKEANKVLPEETDEPLIKL